jgi:hypothetical protein
MSLGFGRSPGVWISSWSSIINTVRPRRCVQIPEPPGNGEKLRNNQRRKRRRRDGRGPFYVWSCCRSLYWDHPTPLTAPSQPKNGLAPAGPPICRHRLEWQRLQVLRRVLEYQHERLARVLCSGASSGSGERRVGVYRDPSPGRRSVRKS